MRDFEDLALIDLGMSNCFRTIDEGLAETLMADVSIAKYYARNFLGYVWYEDGKFICQVWRYHEAVEEVSVDTLEELMETLSEKYGYE